MIMQLCCYRDYYLDDAENAVDWFVCWWVISGLADWFIVIPDRPGAVPRTLL